jgi:acyl-CoA reductase-like NAD-dependent aldehyde dehydrogenase
MIQVVQAFDRAPISQRPGDDAATLERKFAIASKLFTDRKSWLKPHQSMDVLRKLAALKEAKREHFGRQIARESGKPYTDALIETDRAIDGVRNACDIPSHLGWLRNSYGVDRRQRQPPRLDHARTDRRRGGGSPPSTIP